MAKGTRKTSTKRTTTGRGRGGGGGGQQLQGYTIPKMEARGLITQWNKTEKLLTNALDGHKQLFTMLQPIAKQHGLELQSQGGGQTRAKRSTTQTRARTGTNSRRGSQQEPQAASA